jgi:hypothetical protein
MKATPITNYITKEQLENMKVGDQVVFTSEEGTRFRIKKTNESEKCFAWYCLTTKTSICSRCKIDYIIESKVF